MRNWQSERDARKRKIAQEWTSAECETPADILELACHDGTLEWCEKWACRTQQPKCGIVYGNWNDLPELVKMTPDGTLVFGVDSDSDNVEEWTRLDSWFERQGFEVEWSDGVSTCDGCNGLVETEPTDYAWEPRYAIQKGAFVCFDCLSADSPDDVSDCVDLAQNGDAFPNFLSFVARGKCPDRDLARYGWHRLPFALDYRMPEIRGVVRFVRYDGTGWNFGTEEVYVTRQGRRRLRRMLRDGQAVLRNGTLYRTV